MGKDTAKKFAIGAVVAAAAGYVAGILTAPKSGKETRQDIKEVAEKGYSEAEKELKKLHAELDELVAQAKSKAADLTGKTREQLDDLLATAKDSKEKASGILSSLKNGGTEDKELKKSIEEATKAIEHLRKYLAK